MSTENFQVWGNGMCWNPETEGCLVQWKTGGEQHKTKLEKEQGLSSVGHHGLYETCDHFPKNYGKPLQSFK